MSPLHPDVRDAAPSLGRLAGFCFDSVGTSRSCDWALCSASSLLSPKLGSFSPAQGLWAAGGSSPWGQLPGAGATSPRPGVRDGRGRAGCLRPSAEAQGGLAVSGRLRSRAGTDGGGRCLGSRSYFRLVGERALCPPAQPCSRLGVASRDPPSSALSRGGTGVGRAGAGGGAPPVPGKGLRCLPAAVAAEPRAAAGPDAAMSARPMPGATAEAVGTGGGEASAPAASSHGSGTGWEGCEKCVNADSRASPGTLHEKH